MGARTIRVEPAELRATAKTVSQISERLTKDINAQPGIRPDRELAGTLKCAAKAHALAALWQNYLSELGKDIDDYGDRLGLTAKAYRERDEEAAEALRVDLPERRRPGCTAW